MLTLGGLGDAARRRLAPLTLDVGVDGTVDLRGLGLLLGGFRPAGSAAINARLTGPADRPHRSMASCGLTGGELLIRDPRFVLGDLNGEVRFAAAA